MSIDLNNEELQHLRTKLKIGDYDGTDVMKAWLAVDELIELRDFVDIAFKVHPNLDEDVTDYKL